MRSTRLQSDCAGPLRRPLLFNQAPAVLHFGEDLGHRLVVFTGISKVARVVQGPPAPEEAENVTSRMSAWSPSLRILICVVRWHDPTSNTKKPVLPTIAACVEMDVYRLKEGGILQPQSE